MHDVIEDALGRRIRDLRISVTDRCNYRCPYCMPAEIFGDRYHFLPRDEALSYEEIARLTRIFVALGVAKVRITGGEPLMRNDIETLVAELNLIADIEDLTMTTNGYLLANKAFSLKKAGLTRLTVSLDSLDDAVYAEMNGLGITTAKTLAGIVAAEEAGFSPIKVNAVVKRGVNDHTVLELARHFKNSGHILRFIEFMDVGNLNAWDRSLVVPSTELIELIGKDSSIEPVGSNYSGEVAQRWRYIDGGGEIGFISSVTEPFCGACTRARLSPEGKMFTCLFAGEGIDLKAPMRSGATDFELEQIISRVWGERSDRYSELRSKNTLTKRKVEMYQIGG